MTLKLNSSSNPRRIEVLAAVDHDEKGQPMYKDGQSMTRQEFASECDINGIMARYEKVGGHLGMPNREPIYLDLTSQPADLMDAMETMRAAEYAFMTLPAEVRKEFDNDAMRFVEYASDGANIDRLRQWGLAEPAPAEPPVQKVEIVNPAPPPPPKA